MIERPWPNRNLELQEHEFPERLVGQYEIQTLLNIG